jgi:hypothetical protein
MSTYYIQAKILLKELIGMKKLLLQEEKMDNNYLNDLRNSFL